VKETISPDVYKLLTDIQEACRDIVKYTAKGRENFDLDEPTRLSIIWYINKIGTAARLMIDRKMGHEFQKNHPEIDWRGWVHQRNILVHNYDSINFNLVWQTALEAPDLQSKITELLSSVEVS